MCIRDSSYGVNDDGFIDYDKVREIALKERPKLIIAGASAYARTIDFKRFREIADEAGAYLMVDMACLLYTSFTISELEEIYPTASQKAKEDEAYREDALNATYLLQNGHRGYTAVWNHIMKISVADLKKNYANLNVEFDLWKGEADAQAYIPDMIERLKKEGYAHIDEGALVIDVQEETDTKEVPPCMIPVSYTHLDVYKRQVDGSQEPHPGDDRRGRILYLPADCLLYTSRCV